MSESDAGLYSASHRAPFECGDGAGDGPRKASAVTNGDERPRTLYK